MIAPDYRMTDLICISFRRYQELGNKLQQPDLSPQDLRVVGKVYSSLGRLVSLVDERQKYVTQILELIQLENEERMKLVKFFLIVYTLTDLLLNC